MHKFVRNLLTEWRKLKLPFADETIIIAVSGGADSVSLMLALHNLKTHKKINLRFIIANFDHDLRGIKSRNDTEFVRKLSADLDFEFITETAKSKIQHQQGNLEQNARNARYTFLSQTAEKHKAFAILTGHTQNDQAETLLINLIRGSGLDGLAGMAAVRENPAEISIVRPLLSWARREDTEGFCGLNKINFRDDEMNNDLKFSRVKIRKEIIPILQKLNPQIIETLSQTAALLREDAKELSEQCPIQAEFIDQKTLKNLSKSMRLRVLRHWLKRQRGHLRQINFRHLEAIESMLFSTKSGRIIELPNGEKVIKKDGNLFFEITTVEKS